MKKKLISLILAVVVVAGAIPFGAVAKAPKSNSPLGISLAEGPENEDTTAQVVQKGTLGLSIESAKMRTLWNGTTEIQPEEIEGVYQIGTAEELAWFRTHVNQTEGQESDAVLTADIDLNNYNWVPISNLTAIAELYKGTFDGQNHKVSGLLVESTQMNQGLFGNINGATVKNLVVEGNVKSNKNYVGGIIGTTRNSTVENCAFYGTVIAEGRYAGGIIGGNQTNPSIIRNCANMGEVSGGYAGGIMGYSTQKNTIENCYNAGRISGTNRSGGIVGQATAGTITSCYNIGEINETASAYGGIYGFSNAAIDKCFYLYPETQAAGGAASGEEKISSPYGLIARLGSDTFVEDTNGINGGYPTLFWQSGQDTTPSVSLSGESAIYVQKESGKSEATFTISLRNLTTDDIEDVSWTVDCAWASPGDIVTWETPEEDNTSLILKAKSGGTVTITAKVTANGEEFIASRELTVIPQITTIEIVNVNDLGGIAIGQTVKAKVNMLGGEEYDHEHLPPLSYQWKYRTKDAGSGAANISGATNSTFTVTNEQPEGGYLHVEVKCGGEVLNNWMDSYKQIRSADYGMLYPVAYDENFTLPKDITAAAPLTLVSQHTVGGVKADITWTSNNEDIISTDGRVKLPASGSEKVTLTARFEYGDAFANRMFEITVYAPGSQPSKSYLEQAEQSLGEWYNLTPEYGSDKNVAQMLTDDLSAKGFGDVAVSIKSLEEVYGGGNIAPNGDITYFYADPNDNDRSLWLGQYKGTFTLSKDGESLDLKDKTVTIHWDINKVKETLRSEIAGKVTDTELLLANTNLANITGDLSLPRVVDDKKWAQISWTSSDTAAISISGENQGTANTLFNPYVGKVVQGETDRNVTLTAKFTFQRTNLNEPEIAIYKVFNLTVKALSGGEADIIKAQLNSRLDTGFANAGIRDYVTGEKLNETEGKYVAINDIQLPTTRDFGVDGKYYPITLATSDSSVITVPDVANAARAMVYRPLVGESAKVVTITVTITDKAKGISVSRDLNILVNPLTQGEIDNAKALMEIALDSYFDGLNKGRYADDFSVTGGLSSFREVVWNSNHTGVDWIYSENERTKAGIIPDELENWEEQEAWRSFRTSNPRILDHETLNYVAKPKEDTFVGISSVLTHDVLGKYWAKFAGTPGYEEFEQLYKQPVSAYVMVAGENHQNLPMAVKYSLRLAAIDAINAPININFKLYGSEGVLLETTLTDLKAGSTVFEVFRTALKAEGYKYSAHGSYVSSITDLNGNKISERSEGPNSGWIYRVNGIMPSIYMNGYSLEDGDEVVVAFTSDYTKEDDFIWKPDEGKEPVDKGSSNGTSGGAVTGASTQKSTPDKAVSLKSAVEAANSAIKQAKKSGQAYAVVKLRNSEEISLGALQAMVKAAGKIPLTIQANSLTPDSKSVDVRITIKPELAKQNLNLWAATKSDTANKIKSLFGKYFNNKIMVVSFGQKGTFGQKARVAVKLDKTITGKNIYVYSYNRQANTFTRLANANIWLDANGYVHFDTNSGDEIIISDGLLTKKN